MSEKLPFNVDRKSYHKFFFENEDNWTFKIPFYQRSYVWDNTDRQRFFDSLKSAAEKNENILFLGHTIVHALEDDKKYNIVDGQQRLTTTIMMYLAYQVIASVYARELDGVFKTSDITSLATQIQKYLGDGVSKFEVEENEHGSGKLFEQLVLQGWSRESYESLVGASKSSESIKEDLKNVDKAFYFFWEDFLFN